MLHTAYTQPGANEGYIVDRSRAATNRVWFVQSTHADASDTAAFGRHPDRPFSTVDYLVSNATTLGFAAYDTVVFGPGHNEGLGNDQWAMSVASVTYMAHERATGGLAPTLDFDHANTSVDVTANGNAFIGINFRPAITDVLIAVELATNVTGTQFINCSWVMGEDGAGVDDFIKSLVLTSGNDDTKVHNCTMLAHASAAGYTHGIHIVAASDRMDFHNVVIDGPYGTGGIVEAAAGVAHMATALAGDTTGTNFSWHGSSTFARRGAFGGLNLDAAAAEDVSGNLIGRDDANNVADTSNVAANADGSVLERQEFMQSSLIGGIDAATTDSIHGKLGTDIQFADRSIFDLMVGDGPAVYPAAAVPAHDVSIAEVLRDVWDAVRNGTGGTEPGADASIIDAIGTDGVTATVAVAASAVSVLGAIGTNEADATTPFDSTNVQANADGTVLEREEVIQAQVSKLDGVTISTTPVAASLATFVASGGTALGTQLGDSASLVDALGSNGVVVADSAVTVLGAVGADNANNAFASTSIVSNLDGSVLERMEYLQQMSERSVVKTDGECAAALDALFTVATGPIMVLEFVGIVTVEIGGACNCQIGVTSTAPGGNIVLSSDVAIDADTVGYSYTFTAASPSVLTPTAGGTIPNVPRLGWFCPAGTIYADMDAARTGNIVWYMRYVALDPAATVTMAV